MKLEKQRQRLKYIVSDFISANLAWLAINLARYHAVGQFMFDSLDSYLSDPKLLLGQIAIPFFWLAIYYYSGYYNQTSMKSRFAELETTIESIFFGTLVLFFGIVINDLPRHYLSYYKLAAIMFAAQFTLTYIPRAIITALQANRIHNRKIGFEAIILGCGKNAKKLSDELGAMRLSMGYFLMGFIDMGDCNIAVSKEKIIGNKDDIDQIISKYRVKSIIIAPDDLSPENISRYLNHLYKHNLPVSLAANNDYTMAHNVRLSTIYAYPLIDIFNKDHMPEGQKNIKQTLDIIVSSIALLLLTPLFAFLAIRVRKDSKGPVFYKQERLGKNGKPFTIYKFRTMYADSEPHGPKLAANDDERVTPSGKFMRKYRLDELPQFWNVLKGDMSIVGPRPERRYFAEKLQEITPYYYLIYSVKPGITSWAMVKYGYASNVEQMIERLQYDIIYLENRNLLIDLKILVYTIKTIITGKGF